MGCNVMYRISLLLFIWGLSWWSDARGEQPQMLGQPLIVGHYKSGSVYGPNYPIDEVPLDRLTHLIYHFADLTPEGDVILGDRFADVQKLYFDIEVKDDSFVGNFAKLILLKKQNPSLKTIISIGKWGSDKDYAAISATDEGRKKLAKSAVDFILQYGFFFCLVRFLPPSASGYSRPR